MRLRMSNFYLILFSLIVFASILILHRAANTLHLGNQSSINSFVSDANFIEYNHTGQIKTKITAKDITQRQDYILFKNPYIETYTDNRAPWQIRADQAISDQQGKKVVLQGHVIIHELKQTDTPATTIKTSELTLFPRKSFATTDKSVAIYRPGVILHGIGLTANLKTGEYELKSQSKGVYQPQVDSNHQNRTH